LFFDHVWGKILFSFTTFFLIHSETIQIMPLSLNLFMKNNATVYMMPERYTSRREIAVSYGIFQRSSTVNFALRRHYMYFIKIKNGIRI